MSSKDSAQQNDTGSEYGITSSRTIAEEIALQPEAFHDINLTGCKSIEEQLNESLFVEQLRSGII